MLCRNLKPSAGAPSSPMMGPPDTPRVMGRPFIWEAICGQAARNVSL
jgi:hypothetical protein